MGPILIPQNTTFTFANFGEMEDWWNSTIIWIAVATAGTIALIIIVVGIYFFMIKKEGLT